MFKDKTLTKIHMYVTNKMKLDDLQKDILLVFQKNHQKFILHCISCTYMYVYR